MFTWFRNLKVGAKIALGFLIVVLVLFFSILFSINESNRVKVLTDKVVKLRVPTALSSLSMLIGINRSLAALRGWMLLNEDHFKQQRRRAWSEEIDKPLKTMQELSVKWTNPKNAEWLQIIESKLKRLRKYQQEIEDIAHTPENRRALQILAEQAAPTARAIEELLGKMTDNQQQLLQTDLDESHNLSKQTIFSLWVILVVGIAIGGFMALLINRSISIPLRKITDFSKGIAAGDLKQEKLEITTSDEMGVLSKNFNEMVFKLIADLEKTEKQNWLKTGLTELHDKMRGEQDAVTLTQNIITYLVERLNLQIGAVYLAENGTLKLSSGYAYSKGKNQANEFKVGEGLVGQAALEKKSILVTDLPEDYIRIQSGLGEAPPRNILMTPFLYEGRVMGVLELGSVHTIPDDHMKFLNQALDNIAINLNSAQSRTRQRELLQETLAQAEELTSQQEEMKQQQEELQQSNQDLEKQTQILERQKNDIEKKNQMIKQKASQLEWASQYKSEFLANMSHELRTPLNSLLILSGLLKKNREGNLTAKQVEFARTIHDSGSDLLNLINDILDLSKVEAGKMEIQIEAVELASWAASMEQNFAPVATEKGLYLKTKLAPNAPSHIHTDSWRLGQVIKNLMSNAFKFTAEGGVTLKIERPESGTVFSGTVFIDPDLNSDNSVAISVSDTGKGIPKEKQQDIFQAFQQADGTIGRKYGGTGLGLSISSGLVNLLGGEIHLESKEGEGSVFTIYLPIKRKAAIPARETVPEADETVGVPEEAEAGEGAQAAFKSQKSLMIIEDDSRFNSILRGMAEACGFDCVTAENGETGLKLIKKYRPNGIILDIGLPGMDGIEVMKKLRDNTLTRDIPIQIISAFDKRREATDLGAISYLFKPVTEEEIKSAFGNLDKAFAQRNKKILVVEDDEVLRKSILEVLNFENVNVFEAATGREASKLLSSQPFNCMILDLGLPDMAGRDLLEEIKNKDHLKGIPVIIYTGEELTKDQERDLRKFSQSIIIKGVRSPERLIDETRLCLFGAKENLVLITGEKPDKPEETSAKTFAGEKILLVDDDMRNIFALTHSLESLNLSVVIAKSGKEGLEKLEANPDIRLVLMDIMMPDMDGFTAIKEVRKKKKYKDLPVLALTAKAMKGDRQKCLDAGASDYLTKPVNIEELNSKLTAWLTGNK